MIGEKASGGLIPGAILLTKMGAVIAAKYVDTTSVGSNTDSVLAETKVIDEVNAMKYLENCFPIISPGLMILYKAYFNDMIFKLLMNLLHDESKSINQMMVIFRNYKASEWRHSCSNSTDGIILIPSITTDTDYFQYNIEKHFFSILLESVKFWNYYELYKHHKKAIKLGLSCKKTAEDKETYKLVRNAYSKAVKKSKRIAWRSFCYNNGPKSGFCSEIRKEIHLNIFLYEGSQWTFM